MRYIPFIIVALFSLLVISSSAHAQCLPGLPCDVDATPNPTVDVEDDGSQKDGPNKIGEPNEPKRGSSYACDADFMNQIISKAYIESQREHFLSKFMILKPDSVLEYSCFDQHSYLLATTNAEIFTESDQWDNVQVPITASSGLEASGELNTVNVDSVRPVFINTYMEDDRMDKAIENLILESLIIYLESNFDHTFLGGTISSGLDVLPSATVVTATYNCPFMRLVYQDAKCVNFQDSPDFNFHTFDEFGNYPAIEDFYASCGADIEKGFKDFVEISKNLGGKYARKEINFDIYKDEMTYPPILIPPPNQKCRDFQPIATGLPVLLRQDSVDPVSGEVTGSAGVIPDYVCPNPACWYNPEKEECSE